jgi:oligopeptide transport system substrate-binding protein
MKKITSLLLALIMIFASAFALASCGVPEDSGAEINVYLGEEIYDFDPTDYYVSDNAEQVMSLLYDPLFRLNSKGELKCSAAKEYTVNEEDREIVIKLRESYWTDEIRVKAEDYVYAWREELLAPGNPNPAAALLYDIENAVATKAGETSYTFGAVATGIYEITITYCEGADYKQLLENLSSVATAPLRQDIVSVADTFWSKDISTIVTNGPFKIEELDYDTGKFTLSRNIGYHQNPSVKDYTKVVNPASLVSFFSTEDELALTYDDIENKTVFFMSEATLADRSANKDKAKVYDDMSTYTYVFNTEHPLFRDKNVRRALSLALDRQFIIDTVTFGKAATGFLTDSVAKSVYGKNIPDRITADFADYNAVFAEAEALIAAANLKGVSKTFTLTVNDDEESIAIANIAKDAWTRLGFTVKIKAVSSRTSKVEDPNLEKMKDIYDSEIQRLVIEASYGKREFDVIAVDWQMYSRDAFVSLASHTTHINGNGTDFNTGARTSISGWKSFDYDNYLTAAYKAETEADRNTALAEAEKILIDESPVIPIMYNQNFAFVSGELSKVATDGYGNFVFTDTKQKNYKKYLPSED